MSDSNATSDTSFDSPAIFNDSRLAARQLITAKQGVLYKKPGHSGLYWRVPDKEYDLTSPEVDIDSVSVAAGSAMNPTISFKQAPDIGFSLSDDHRGLILSVGGAPVGRFSTDAAHFQQLFVGGTSIFSLPTVDPSKLEPYFVELNAVNRQGITRVTNNFIVQCFDRVQVHGRNNQGDNQCPEIYSVLLDASGQPEFYGKPFADRDIIKILCMAYHDEQIILVYVGHNNQLMVRTFDQLVDSCVPIGRPACLGEVESLQDIEILGATHLAIRSGDRHWALLDKWRRVSAEAFAEISQSKTFAAWKADDRFYGRGHLVHSTNCTSSCSANVAECLDSQGNSLGFAVDGRLTLP